MLDLQRPALNALILNGAPGIAEGVGTYGAEAGDRADLVGPLHLPGDIENKCGLDLVRAHRRIGPRSRFDWAEDGKAGNEQ
jgi:hypothetical protein